MYDQWVEAFEDDKLSAVVMLDLSAAFDVVDHEILIQKLEIYGFEECCISWFQSYLTNRSQQVYVEGSLSDPLLLEAGVPQGSILGPILYILYTNDLAEVVHDHNPTPPQDQDPLQPAQDPPHEGQEDQPYDVHDQQQDLQVANAEHPPQLPGLGVQEPPHSLYFNINCESCGGICIFADDSTFTLSNQDPAQLTLDIRSKYKEIASYMSKNKLILNGDKTHLLVMTSSRKHLNHQNFGITLDTGTEIIEPSYAERLLGGNNLQQYEME